MDTFLTQLDWQRPWFLLWLLFPVAVKLLPVRRLIAQYRSSHLMNLVEPHLLPYMLIHPAPARRYTLLACCGWLLAVSALAGPYIKHSNPSPANRLPLSRNIVVTVDISQSMLTQDILPNRLTRAKKELQDLVNLLPQDRLALVAYATNAYLALPFTRDHALFAHFAENLAPSLTQQNGSSLVRAIEFSRHIITSQKKGGGSIILLTDGGKQLTAKEVGQAAQRLADDNIHLMVLAIGTRTGGMVMNNQGQLLLINENPIISRLDRNLLQSISTVTHGQYSELTADNKDWLTLTSALPEPTQSPPALQPGKDDLLLFPWLLGAGFCMFVILAVQGQPLLPGLLAFFLLLPINPSVLHASPLNSWYEQKGQTALQAHHPDSAQQYYSKSNSYIGIMGLGVSLYRQQKWQQAKQAFSLALQKSKKTTDKAAALYNLGNASAQLKQYREAQNYYYQVLQLRPGHKKATLNLTLVNRQLDTLHTQTRTTQSASAASNNQAEYDQHNPTSLTLPAVAASTFSKDRQIVYIPDIDDDTQTLLRYRFAQQDKISSTNLSKTPW